jgi:hypothetical protein
MSNSDCLPGRAGGTPDWISWTLSISEEKPLERSLRCSHKDLISHFIPPTTVTSATVDSTFALSKKPDRSHFERSPGDFWKFGCSRIFVTAAAAFRAHSEPRNCGFHLLTTERLPRCFLSFYKLAYVLLPTAAAGICLGMLPANKPLQPQARIAFPC